MASLSTVSILFCDLVGSTELMTRIGDAANDEVRRMCFAAWRRALREHRGTEVKARGAGLMACFVSAVDGVEGAAALQVATARLDHQRPELGLALRVGMSAGDASFDDGDWYGIAVVEAARLCDAAGPGQILVADVVAAMARSRSDRSFVDAGAYDLKGLSEPLRVMSVGWERPPAGPVPLPRPLVRAGGAFSFFVGRGVELDRLTGGWTQVAAGDRRCFFVAGEPGIGKTTLVAEAARRAHEDGGTVLYGRCDQELATPFQPFAEALRGLLVHGDAALMEQVHPYLGAVSRLVPVVRDLAPDLPPPAPADQDLERQLLFEAVDAILTHIGPVVLVLDDLHWATTPTLLLLRHLLLTSTAGPLLVLATYRDTDLSRTHPLSGMLADLRRADAARRIGLRGFTLDEGTAFVEAAAGHDLAHVEQRLAETVHEVTAGNPLFLREVLSHLVDAGAIYQRDGRWVTDIGAVGDLERLGLPEGVRDAISRRLTALSARANNVLQVAAVIGPAFELRVLDRIPELAGDAVVDALDEVLATGLLAEGEVPGSYQFVHALVRQTLLDELSSTRRMRLHRRVAEALEVQPDVADRAGALAFHCAEAALDGCAEKAADYALVAARHAHDRAAPEEALWHATRALEALDLAGVADRRRRADLHLAVGRASDDHTTARTAFLEAADLARAENDARRLAETAIRLNRLTVLGQEDTETEALLTEALDRADDGVVRCGVMACLALHLYRAGSGKGADLAEEALDEARRLDDDRALVAALWSRLIVLTGSPDLALRRRLTGEVTRAVERMAASGAEAEADWDPGIYSHDLNLYQGIVLLQAGDRVGFDAFAEAFLASPAARSRSDGELIRAFGAMVDGRLPEAEAAILAGLEHQNDRVGELNNFLVQFMLLRRDQGRWHEIFDTLAASARANPSLVAFESAVAAAEAELGRLDDAASRLRALARPGVPRVPRDSLFPTTLSFLSVVAFAVGDGDAAAALLPEVEAYRGQVLTLSGWVAALGVADHFEAMLLATLDRFDEATVRFDAARSLGRGLRSDPFVARTDVAEAEMLLRRARAGDLARARTLLAEAQAVGSALGLEGVRRQAAVLAAGA